VFDPKIEEMTEKQKRLSTEELSINSYYYGNQIRQKWMTVHGESRQE
jgi:hypothetical protein